MTAWIAHICDKNEWQAAERAGEYRAASLEDEGFIHCSRPEQILDVANHFYAGAPDLVLLCIDPQLLDAELRWETVDEEVFPHLYGPINLIAVKSVRPFTPDVDGEFHHLPEC